MNRLDLHAYVDGELSGQEREAVEAYLNESPGARAEIQAIESLKKSLCSVPAPEAKAEWRACVGRLNDIDKSRRIESLVGRYSWALCGAFFLFIAIGGLTIRNGGTRVQSADLARMATSFTRSAENPQDAYIAKELDRRLQAAARSIDPNRMQVLRADRGIIQGLPVARLILRDASGEMALLMFPQEVEIHGLQPMTESPAYQEGKMGLMNCVAWEQAPYQLALCGERNTEMLAVAAQRLTVR